MPLRPADVEAAQGMQLQAAHDTREAVRLVAGPGTGKSSSIEERFRWLYEDAGVAPASVFGVSFTRAAAKDLRIRVAGYLAGRGLVIDSAEIRVSTLHSLALTLLSRANLLGTYPTRPRVLDEWEVDHVFDAEFSVSSGQTEGRSEDVRRAHEAFWSTGMPMPPGYIEPSPPITDGERRAFAAHHQVTTQTYSAVLPGEIVRLCVEQVEAGHLRLREVADMAFLIVDEYQDLNPLDIKLVDLIAADGVGIFAAGDDDQSIYSFRFAAPGGIQDFTARHPGAGDHVLEGCFRCATSVVSAADTLIEHFSPGSRIPKTLESLWSTSLPPASGYVSRWRVPTGAVEAELVAESVRRLIDANVPPKNVMILLSNKRVFPAIRAQLIAKGIPFTPPRESTWTDTDGGRFVLGLLRALSDTGDYMALRLILGCRRQVGVRTCAGIVRKVTDNLLNYRALFFAPLPAGVFGSREMSALLDARAALAAVDGFDESDELQNRAAVIRRLLVDARSESEAAAWDDLMTVLPAESTLEELRDYLAADNEEQQETVLSAIFARLDQPIPPGLPEPRVRVMTMHGAKGLQADVVFIPALEEQILPGPRRAMSPGLVLEGARLLYVSMTRARAGLVMSLSRRRMWQGRSIAVSPSRYASHVGGAFVDRGAPLSAAEARDIADLASLMRT